jgi:lambda family phage portal protein
MAADLLARHYEAASTGRRTSGWRRSSSDANAAAGGALSRLRDHARDLVRNNPYAESATSVIADHTVGWGIVPSSDDKRAMATWKEWAETPACDADGRNDIYGLQKLAMKCVVTAGEVLVRRRLRRPEDGLPIPIQLQVIEADYLDTSKTGLRLPNGGRIIHGKEFNAIGRCVAYWLFPEHPGSGEFFSGASQRVPAENVIHIFRQGRPGQVRGVSWFAPVITALKDFDELADAQLYKHKVAACLALVYHDPTGASIGIGEVEDGADNGDGSRGPDLERIGPGTTITAPPGWDVEVVQPPRVSDYGDFAQVTLRMIATGLGVTYEDLTGDYCIAPETRVLRGDLRWVKADELREGDSLVAFDEERLEGRGQRRKWRQASVVRAGRRDLPRVRIVTDKTAVIVSEEHMFLCTGPEATKGSKKNPYGHRWVEARNMKPGDEIAFLAEPWEEGRSHVHGYLKGIADGEGCVDKNSAHINISQNPGPVCDEIGAALSLLGFAPVLRGSAGSTVSWELSGTAKCLRFLGEVRPTRLLEKAANIYDGRAMSGGKGKRGQQSHAVVLSAERCGRGPVVTLATTTHTVITEGLCSHNTNMPFSAARMSRLRHWSRVEDWRWQTLIPQFCEPAWRWFVQVAAVFGMAGIDARTEWTAPPPPMIDPSAEGLAYARNIRSGIVSLPEVLRERGYNPKTVLDEIAKSNKILDKLGLVLDSDPRRTNQNGQFQSAPTAPPEEDDDEPPSDDKQSAEIAAMRRNLAAARASFLADKRPKRVNGGTHR